MTSMCVIVLRCICATSQYIAGHQTTRGTFLIHCQYVAESELGAIKGRRKAFQPLNQIKQS